MTNRSDSYISFPVEEFNKQQDAWALAIGRFLVTFTICEHWTYQYIETFGSKRLREAVGTMGLGARADIAQSLVSDIGLTKEMQARVDEAFAELEKLAKPRNLVAHNGPMFHMFKKGEGHEMRHELRSSRDPTRDITIKELEEQQSAAIKLSDELALIYGLVRQPENQLKGQGR